MSKRPPRLLWVIPIIAAVSIAWLGWRDYSYSAAVSGVSGSAAEQLRRDETLRWGGSACAALVLSVSVIVAVWWDPRYRSVRVAKAVVLGLLFVYSCAPAYWPEHEWMAKGWIVHPPRIAIHGPAIVGFVTFAMARVVYLGQQKSRRAAL